MKDKKYSDGLLDEMFKVIDEKLDKIIEQTTKTNGRVTVLESWRGVITGGLTVITVVVIPVVFKVVFP